MIEEGEEDVFLKSDDGKHGMARVRRAWNFLTFHTQRIIAVYPRHVGLALIAVTLSGLSFALASRENTLLVETRQALRTATGELRRTPDKSVAADTVANWSRRLPPFRATALVSVLNATAEETQVTLGELGFEYDQEAGSPIVRYRASFSLDEAYKPMRHFVQTTLQKLPNAAIDKLECKRDGFDVAELSCDLVISAYFLEAG